MFLVIVFISVCSSTLISSSKVTKCINDGSTNPLGCSNKMIVTLAVDSVLSTESVAGFVGTATTDSGASVLLESPLRVTVTRSVPGLLFPISYVQSTNNRPYEFIQGLPVTEFCNADPNAADPSCGWYLNPDGSRVAGSQGFCCTCSLAQIFGSSTASRLGGCSLFGQNFYSLSCLRFDDVWYDTFTVGTSEVYYEIYVTISYWNATTSTQSDETIVLSPQNLKARSSDGSVLGDLVGDFSSFKTFPDLSQNYLFVPSRPSSSARVQEGRDGYMLLPRDLVDLTGMTPNKVGVSFQGFNNQPNACTNPAGSGLQNQLDDYYKADSLRRSKGLATNYFASSFGTFTLRKGSANDATYLFYTIDRPASSVVTLTLSADNIVLIQNNAPGKINSAYVLPFESQSKNGMMRVMISNIGRVSSNFDVTVTECSPNIAPVLAQRTSLQPFQSTWLSFALSSEVALGSANNVCTVRLLDSLANVQDLVIVRFNTTDTLKNDGAQGGNAPNISSSSVVTGSGSGSDIRGCGQCSFINILCQIQNACYADIFKAASSVLLPIAAGLLLLKLLSMPSVRAAIGRLLCGCCQGSQHVEEVRYEVVPQKRKVVVNAP